MRLEPALKERLQKLSGKGIKPAFAMSSGSLSNNGWDQVGRNQPL